MTKTRLVSVFLASALVASPLAAQEIGLVLTSEAADRDSVLGRAMQTWAAMIEENSDGRIDVDAVYQGELGGQQELFEQLVRGNIHLMITWPQTSHERRIGVTCIPNMGLGWDDAVEVFGKGGRVRDVIEPVYEDMDLHYCGPFTRGVGDVTTKGRYATGLEEADGLRVRSQPIFLLPQTVEAMGFQAVPIDCAAVYTSVQTGVVDGGSSNVIFWDYEYLRDQLDCFLQSSHNFSSHSRLMNGDTWQDMSDEDRKIVEDAATAVTEQQFVDAHAEDERRVAAAQEAGMDYIVPTPEQKRACVDPVRTEVWPQVAEAPGPEIMDVVDASASVPN